MSQTAFLTEFKQNKLYKFTEDWDANFLTEFKMIN